MPRPGYEDATAETVPETSTVPQYAVSMIAQQWNNDSYYVASSKPKYPITVVADTKHKAIDAAAEALGPPSHGYYWRFFNITLKDARLVADEVRNV